MNQANRTLCDQRTTNTCENDVDSCDTSRILTKQNKFQKTTSAMHTPHSNHIPANRSAQSHPGELTDEQKTVVRHNERCW